MATWSHTFPIGFNRYAANGVTVWGDIQYFTPPSGISITGCKVFYTVYQDSGVGYKYVYINQQYAGSIAGGSGATIDHENITPGARNRFSVSLIGASGGGATFNIVSIRIELTYDDSSDNPLPLAGKLSLSKTSVAAGAMIDISLPKGTAGETRKLYLYVKNGTNFDYVRLIDSYTSAKQTIRDYEIKEEWCGKWATTSTSFTLKFILKSPGTEISATLAVSVPISAIPTIEDLNLTLVQPAGWPLVLDECVQLLTQVEAEIIGASGVLGSTIKAYEIIDILSSKQTKKVATFGPFADAIGGQFRARVQDSRGRWSTPTTVDLTVREYATPTLTYSYARRTDDLSIEDDEGESVTLLGRIKSSSVNGKNSITLKGRLYPKRDTPSPTWFTMVDDTPFRVDEVSQEQAFIAEIKVEDLLGGRIYTFTIPTGVVGENILPGVTGAAYGMYAVPGRFSIPSHWGFYVGDQRADVPVINQVIMLMSDDNPADIWPGTVWVMLAQGRFPISAGADYSTGTTGGSETHVHEMGNASFAQMYPAANSIEFRFSGSRYFTANRKVTPTMTAGSSTAEMSNAVLLGGQTDSSNYKPPWIAIAMWRRTA